MKTLEPPIYDIWDHHQRIKDYLNWLKSERFHLNKYIPASALDYEVVLTKMKLRNLEKIMKIEFVGDVLNLSMVQRETFHKIEPPIKSVRADSYELITNN